MKPHSVLKQSLIHFIKTSLNTVIFACCILGKYRAGCFCVCESDRPVVSWCTSLRTGQDCTWHICVDYIWNTPVREVSQLRSPWSSSASVWPRRSSSETQHYWQISCPPHLKTTENMNHHIILWHKTEEKNNAKQ